MNYYGRVSEDGLHKVVLNPKNADRCHSVLKHKWSTPLFDVWKEDYQYLHATMKNGNASFYHGDDYGVIVFEETLEIENKVTKVSKNRSIQTVDEKNKEVFFLAAKSVSIAVTSAVLLLIILSWQLVIASFLVIAVVSALVIDRFTVDSVLKISSKNTNNFVPSTIPKRDEYSIITSGTCNNLISLLKAVDNNVSVVRTVRDKMKSAENDRKFSTWVEQVNDIFSLDRDFPFDSIPLLNDDLMDVHAAVIKKSNERKKRQKEIESPAKNYEKQFRIADSKAAKNNAMIYLETSD